MEAFIEPDLVALVDAAEVAGLERDDIWPAILDLAVKHIVFEIENEKLDARQRTERLLRMIWPDAD